MPDVKDLPTAKLAYPRAATVMLSIRGRMGYPTRPNASAMSVEQVARVGWPESSLVSVSKRRIARIIRGFLHAHSSVFFCLDSMCGIVHTYA
jgi:hypothetical protein